VNRINSLGLKEMENNIKELIAKRGYKQKFVANQLGISAQQLSNWIKGTSTPRLEVAYKLADFLEVDVTEVWKNDNE